MLLQARCGPGAAEEILKSQSGVVFGELGKRSPCVITVLECSHLPTIPMSIFFQRLPLSFHCRGRSVTLRRGIDRSSLCA
jgi:hypothetical protein